MHNDDVFKICCKSKVCIAVNLTFFWKPFKLFVLCIPGFLWHHICIRLHTKIWYIKDMLSTGLEPMTLALSEPRATNCAKRAHIINAPCACDRARTDDLGINSPSLWPTELHKPCHLFVLLWISNINFDTFHMSSVFASLFISTVLTPVAGLIFETKNRAIFLERFFWSFSGEALLPVQLCSQ